MLPKRPNRKESEDDILRQQEEFLRQKKSRSKVPSPESNKQQSVNSADNATTEKATTDLTTPKGIVGLVHSSMQIVERDLGHNPEYAMLYVNRNMNVAQTESGFPFAENILTKGTDTSTRGPSLYAQKFLKKTVSSDQNDEKKLVSDSGIVSGDGLGSEHWKRDIAEIKHQNERLINNMSVEEIETTRAEIMKKLSPKMVAFLQSKQFKYRSEVIKENEQKAEEAVQKIKEQEETPVSDVNVEDVTEKLAIPIEEVQSKKYVNMNVIEKEKLSWMGDIPAKEASAKNLKEAVDFSARFNFEGDLISLDKADVIDVHEGLHHHGEEPDRPGYTVNELFMYLQSSFPSQKQIGLKVFEKIISKAYLGIYDTAFNANLIEYLLKDTPLVLVVRTCLDDTGETVWKSAISTLKAIICNTIYDEMFLDRGYLLFEDYLGFGYRINLELQPLLDNEVEIDEQVPDQQYAMYDLVACLLNRTSILQRFAFLIKHYLHSGDVVFIEEILDILIRMARHSKVAAEGILTCSELMDALCSQLIRRSVLMSQCRLMHCKAFKLVRVCISSIIATTTTPTDTLPSSLSRLFDCFTDISFLDSLNLSLLLNPEDVSLDTARLMLQISIESLRTWLKLLSLISSKGSHPFLDSLQGNFRHMFPAFVRILNFGKTLIPIEATTDSHRSTFDFQFASCVFALVKMYHEVIGANEYTAVYSFDLFDIAMKWLTHINTESIVPDFDTCTCLLVLTEFILKHRKLDDQFLNIAYVKLFNDNDRFSRRLFELCCKNSNTAILKQETPGTVRDSANHPSFGSIYFRGSRSVPLLNVDSPICLLQALLRIASNVPSSTTTSVPPSTGVITRLSDYIALVTANTGKDFTSNIFDLIEINIVSEACLLIPKQRVHPPQVCKTVLRFALMVNILNSNAIKRQIIDQVLFNHQLYASLSSSPYSAEHFASIREAYRGFSRFDNSYWLFHPLLAKEGANDEVVITIELKELLSCLQFINIVFTNFPEHFAQIDIVNNELFFLLATAFLVDDSHFFNEDVRDLLTKFLQRLLESPGGIVCTTGDTIPNYGNVVDL